MDSSPPTAETIVTLESSGKLARLCEILRERSPQPGDSLALQRQAFEEAAARMPVPGSVRCRPVDAGGVPAEWIEPLVPIGSRTLLYFHGGGYIMGSLITIRTLVANIANAMSAPVLSVGYRLAPEHPYPAAVEDGVTAYAWLLQNGAEPATTAVAGDSAGGGLAIAVLLAARDKGLPLPAAAVCLSPWVDLTLSGASLELNDATDPQVEKGRLTWMRNLYLAGEDPHRPLASPAFADLTGLPPLLIQAGTVEALKDDAVMLTAAARRAGVQVTLELYEAMIHVWHAFAPGLPEATVSIERIAAWLAERCGEMPR